MSSTNRDAAADVTIAQLRARLAAAEAVIAALPRCDRCDGFATQWDDCSVTFACDECTSNETDLPTAAPLRAYLALKKEGGQ